MHRRLHAAASDRAAAGDVDRVAQQGRADRVAWRGHRRVALPGVGNRVVAFHLAEHAGLGDLPVGLDAELSAHSKEAVAVNHQPKAGTRRGQRGARFPGVAIREIHVVQAGVVFERVEAAADHVDAAVMGHDPHVVPRAR